MSCSVNQSFLGALPDLVRDYNPISFLVVFACRCISSYCTTSPMKDPREHCSAQTLALECFKIAIMLLKLRLLLVTGCPMETNTFQTLYPTWRENSIRCLSFVYQIAGVPYPLAPLVKCRICRVSTRNIAVPTLALECFKLTTMHLKDLFMVNGFLIETNLVQTIYPMLLAAFLFTSNCKCFLSQCTIDTMNDPQSI